MATNAKSATTKTVAKTAEVKKTAVKTTKTVEVKKAEEKKVAVKAPKTKKVQRDVVRNSRKVLRGIVVSNKMDKTGVVEITRKVPHPLYKKVVTKTTRFKFHDENNECSIGDTIEIMETRPLSKDKYFRLVRIVEKVK